MYSTRLRDCGGPARTGFEHRAQPAAYLGWANRELVPAYQWARLAGLCCGRIAGVQSVLHALLEILPSPPNLVVSGINYGENLGTNITISGTVGAAMEAAAMGIPAMAVSLQILSTDYLGYADLDFFTAGHFTFLFARMLLEKPFPDDVDLLKVEVPAGATPDTPWRMTRLARHRYYHPVAERPGKWDEPYVIEGRPKVEQHEADSITNEPLAEDIINHYLFCSCSNRFPYLPVKRCVLEIFCIEPD